VRRLWSNAPRAGRVGWTGSGEGGAVDHTDLPSVAGCTFQRAAAERELQALQDHPDTWQRVDAIIEQTQNENTKFFALRVRAVPI
jgi:hypothetical protein